MKILKTQRGLTLVTLVITVAVLFILSAVMIREVTDDGIIQYAENAKTKFEEKAEEENELLKSQVSAFKGSNAVKEVSVGIKATRKSTVNGEAYGSTNPVIPKGFKAINTDKAKWDASGGPEVLKGLVISDGSNEFVWVPVSDINDMVMCKRCGANSTIGSETLQCKNCGTNTILVGKLYGNVNVKFNASLTGQTYGSNTGYREADVVTKATGTNSATGTEYDAVNVENLGCTTDYDDNGNINTNDLKLQFESEFKDMAKSVAKYGGFYVGRYETSLSNIGIAQSQPGEIPMNNINWYDMYKNSKTYSTSNATLGVTSEMIWGCQWDAMLKFILKNPQDASHVTATTNVGHTSSDFKIKPYETGGTNYSVAYKGTVNNKKYGDIASNIYDLEGNMREWTQESANNNGRVSRGGYCNGNYSPSARAYHNPNNESKTTGSRLSLYVK